MADLHSGPAAVDRLGRPHGGLASPENPVNGALDVLSTCITIAGANTFEVGTSVQQYSVGTGGVVSLSNPSNPSSATTARNTALKAILAIG